MEKLTREALLASLHKQVRLRFPNSLTGARVFFRSDMREAYYKYESMQNRISFVRMLQMFDQLGYDVEFQIVKREPKPLPMQKHTLRLE